MFYESPIIGDSWIAIPIILYAYTTFNRNEANEQYYVNLNLILILGISALDVNLCLLSIMLYLFNFVYNSVRNFNA
ncbi:hypothetical protein FACS1894218_2420 [Bacilli bacterium]|nr:hypothetical protein FACS1894218_2420 [Bacilli bacterium]